VLAKTIPQDNARFVIATPVKVAAAKNAESLCAQKANLTSNAAMGSASNSSEQSESQMFETSDATVSFEGRIYFPDPNGSATDFLAAKIQGDYEKAVEAFLKNAEGDFSVLIAQAERLLAARDPVGVQPLYFGENEAIAALATNRKALWELGMPEPKSFPPGHLGTVTKEGFKFKPVQTLPFSEPKPIGLDEAAKKLQRLLEQSVQRRIFGLKEVAVAFSGGLDSSLVACLAKRCGVDVHLIHVSLKDQPETEEARKAAKELALPLQVHLFTDADVEKVISEVVALIEEADPIKASVGVPFFWNAQKAAESGYRVLLAGQGADEFFGGYQRYVNEYILEGDEAVRKTMFHDVAVIHESNIERDEKICGFYDVELRLPFASFEVAEFAMSLPTDLKIEKKTDSLRKLVLRKTALNMGLSKSIADKHKKAVQYSTGINSAVKKLAKKQNLTQAEYVNRLFLEAKGKSAKP
jgi:asparagine synthase (glutamine-hydrolysing)